MDVMGITQPGSGWYEFLDIVFDDTGASEAVVTLCRQSKSKRQIGLDYAFSETHLPGVRGCHSRAAPHAQDQT